MTADGDTGRRRDFFISYTGVDQAWAEWIAWILEEDGYRILLQAWDFVPGSNWIQSMHAGIQDADRVIAVLSDNYLKSVYGGAEWQAAWASDPTGEARKLLVVRIADCGRPGLLAGVVGVDLFGIDEPAVRGKLRHMIAAAVSGRAKPLTAPRFPGAGRSMPRKPRFPGSLPRIWNVPPHNPNFTGRNPELEKLAEDLASGSAVTVQSVHGMGGVGKTQLAIEYAHAHAASYDLAWWIAAEEPAALPDQFTALATRLDLEPASEPEALQEQIRDGLRGITGWLLVLDNADAVSDIRPWLPSGPMPARAPGHVIVTTRRGGFATLGRVMDLDVIDLPDAVRLLRTQVPSLDQATGEQIARELGRLPLALEQAAAYMDRVQIPGEDYLALLHEHATDMYGRGAADAGKNTIATLWQISLERIQQVSPEAVQLLEICAYLAPEPIPLDLFTSHADLLPEPLSSAAGDQLAFTEVAGVLADYSLAKRSSAGLQLHRLVQAVIRGRRERTEQATRPAPGES